jgi:hypothetical protein
MEYVDHKSVLRITSLTLFYGLRNSLMNVFNCNAFSAKGISKVFGEMQFTFQRQCACMHVLVHI